MDDALFWHRLQFAFTLTYHYGGPLPTEPGEEPSG
jgi:hypothetical protein